MDKCSLKAILEQTRLENLLKHYDINDFLQFIAKKNFLSSSELKCAPSSKQEAVTYIASRDKFHSQFLQVFEEYRVYVTKDVTIALAEILPTVKLSVRELEQQLPSEIESESDSFSQSSFSDDSDTDYNMHSQALPSDNTECSGILHDSGYYTQSNTQSLSGTSHLPSLQETSEKESAKCYLHCHPKQTKVYITKNYCNNYYMDSRSTKHTKLPFTEQGLSQDCAAKKHHGDHRKLQSSVDKKIREFKKAIQKHNHELIACMNVQSLLPYLQAQELLTTHEYEKLTQAVHSKTQSEQNHCLLRILPTKGEHAFERFLTCLAQADEHLGHQQLVTLLTRQTR